jgi:hypothetical protein
MKTKCPQCGGKGCSHCGGTGYHSKTKAEMSKGGMTKKRGYAHGGMVKCGASNPPSKKR